MSEQKERLIIKNFGPIKEVDIELRRFNILIGKQATGKSTILKVLAICRYFSFIADGLISNFEYINNFMEGLTAYGIQDYLTTNSEISYENLDYSFSAVYSPDIITYEGVEVPEVSIPNVESELTPRSDKFNSLIKELKKLKPEKKNDFIDFQYNTWRPPSSFYQNDVKQVMSNPYYFPTERSLQSIFSLGYMPNLSNSLSRYFAKTDEILKKYGKDTDVGLLDLQYKYENNNQVFRNNKHKDYLNLRSAASGYQSVIPLALVIQNYNAKKRSKTFLIEEPELNLFPDAQRELVRFMIKEQKVLNSQFLIATHSPYILTSINNCLLAYQVSQRKKNETLGIAAAEYWLDPKETTAFMLKTDGTAENILDEEEGLIKAEKVDAVSSIINGEFEDLLNIEYRTNDTN
jgi:hypothetical protein